MFSGTQRFQVLRKLGEGGMGVVYEAVDRESGERVALKTLRIWSPEALLRFKSEFRGFQHLDHPNLVRLGELFEDDGVWCFTMELLEGVPWTSYVRSAANEPLPYDDERLRKSLSQLIDGLSCLHAAGAIHRDVKPSNILVTLEGREVLLDFGLARNPSALDNASGSVVVGTPAYMAPEQADSSQVSAAADWYSVGVLLYQALTGHLPFTGTPAKVIEDKKEKVAASPSSRIAGIPEDLNYACVHLLAIDPAQRTVGVTALRNATHGAGPTTSEDGNDDGPVKFVGRLKELERLHALFSGNVASPAPSAICLWGESGIGKTSLVEQFVRELCISDPSVVILSGRCYETESVPYNAIDGVIDSICRYLARLPNDARIALLPEKMGVLVRAFPVLLHLDGIPVPSDDTESGKPQSRQRQLVDVLCELLRGLGEASPVLLTIEDIHWADSDSAWLLTELFKGDGYNQLRILVTSRSEYDGGPPRWASAAANLADLEVGPLDDEDTGRLIREFSAHQPRISERDVKQVLSESKGRPLFVQELMASPGAGEVVVTEGPVTLDERIWQRVCELPTASQRLLGVVAMASKPVLPAIVSRATGIEMMDLTPILKRLKKGRLLRVSDDIQQGKHIEVYHDIVRQTVRTHLSDAACKSHHRKIAEAFTAMDVGDAEELSFHWREAGESEKALQYLEVAADRAQAAFAYERSRQLYLQCLQWLDGGSPHRRDVQEKLAAVTAISGRGAESAQLYSQLAEDDRSPALQLKCLAIVQYLRSGHVRDGLRELDEALNSIGGFRLKGIRFSLISFLWSRIRLRLRGLVPNPLPSVDLPSRVRDRLDVYSAAIVGLHTTDAVRAMDFHGKYLLLALNTGAHVYLALGYAFEVFLSAGLGKGNEDYEESLLRTIVDLASKPENQQLRALPLWARTGSRFLRGDWAAVVELMERGDSVYRSQHIAMLWERSYLRLNYLWSLCYLGNFNLVNKICQHEHFQANESQDFYLMTAICSGFPNARWLVCDDVSRARQDADTVMARWKYEGFYLQHYIHIFGHVQADLYEGRWNDAFSRAMQASTGMRRSLLSQVRLNRILAEDLMGRSALGVAASNPPLTRKMLSVARRSSKRLRAEKTLWSLSLACVLDAGIAFLEKDVSRTLTLLRDADGRFERNGMRYHQAAVQLCWRRIDEAHYASRNNMTPDAYFAEQYVRRPLQFARIVVPWMPV